MNEKESPQAVKKVQFWFDAICPWTWVTSRWLKEVSDMRGFEVEWLPFSLVALNEGGEDPYPEAHARGQRIARVVQAAWQENPGKIGELYTQLGERLHPGGRDDHDAVIAEALAAAELPAALSGCADDAGLDDALRVNTRCGVELVGPGVGIPIIALNGLAFFGPVVSPAPTGEKALALWDALETAMQVDGFYELKRGRTVGVQF